MADMQAQHKLQLGRVWDALVFPFKSIGPLLRIGLFPALIALVLSYLTLELFMARQAPVDTPGAQDQLLAHLDPAFTIVGILFTVVAAIFAVGIHRLILREEQPAWLALRFSRFELAYLTLMLLVFVAYALEQNALLLLFTLAGGAAGARVALDVASDPEAVLRYYRDNLSLAAVAALVAGMALLTWVHIRLALIFPHAAVTGRIALVPSWRAMGGNVWRMIAAGILLAIGATLIWLVLGTIAVTVAATLAAAVAGTPGGDASRAAFQALIVVGLGVMPPIGLLVAVMVSFLSYAYKDLVEGIPEPGGI